MNWYKKIIKKSDVFTDEQIDSILHEDTKIEDYKANEIIQLLRSLPAGHKVRSESPGWSILDKDGRTIVYKEPSLELAVKQAVPRFRYISK